jgi:hypothetical protein
MIVLWNSLVKLGERTANAGRPDWVLAKDFRLQSDRTSPCYLRLTASFCSFHHMVNPQVNFVQ